MAKKGILVWLFSTLTFLSLIHFIEAIYALAFNGQIRLLTLYPLINERLQVITPMAYFLVSAVATFIFWGITCAVAFENPVETFLNKILSDAKTQTAVEAQLLEEKSEILDMMNETIESNSQNLAQVKDIIYNVRTEVKELQPLKENVEKIRAELSNLKKEIKKIEEKVQFPNICPACGNSLLPEFKICPYCGEPVKVPSTPVIALKDYK